MAGLYIHIPYCHSKCAYCDFYSRPDDGNMQKLTDALVAEYMSRRDEIGEIRTIYIGGGTPSVLPDSLLRRLVGGITQANSLDEFTIEANPEDISDEKLLLWKELGIDRISMGVQSLNDEELGMVGRRHTARQALDAIQRIQNAGFEKISCDLIYGLPGQTTESWRASLAGVLDTGITHMSAYALMYEEGTRLYARMSAGKIKPADDDLYAAMYAILIETAAARGFRHYEVSNFALPGFEAVHNRGYWNSTPYLGLGPSAHSFDGLIRRINPASVKEYLAKIPSFYIEDESDTDRINDHIITALRTDTGLDLNTIPSGCVDKIARPAQKWARRGMLEFCGNMMRIPERYWIVSDSIMRDLLID